LVVTDAVPGPNGSRIVYLRQAIGDIEVASGPLTVAVDRGGRVVHAAGRLTPRLSNKAASASATLSAEAAATALAQAANVSLSEPFRATEQKAGASRETVMSTGGVTRLPVRARLVYAVDGNALRLAWETTLYLHSGGDWFGHVDAATGRVIRVEDRLVRDSFGHTPTGHTQTEPIELEPYEAQAPPMVPFALRLADELVEKRGGASYRVFALPLVSPIHHADAVPPADGRTLVTNPHDPVASPFGWHDTDGAEGAEFTITRGNNTHAYLDRDDDEGPDTNGEPDGGSALAFDFGLDFGQDPSLNRDASVTNLFYWTNVIHDVLHHYGFDEASGNFQATNYSGTGIGGDAVDAESQSGADICNEFFPCVNNANFSTPSEGGEPRMQMYVGTNGSPEIDGSYDNMVVVHEYGHGITIRLTGGPSNVGCLSTTSYPEQMGEGWSDWYGAMFTMSAEDQREDPVPVGNYLFGQTTSGPGIRPAPYSTDFGVNAYTYGDTNDGALPIPHGVGFVWATALWELTWDLIDAYGFDANLWDPNGTAGNQKAMHLVTTALKLQPCGPGFVDGRDAIYAADELLYGGAHLDLLGAAFARRGLGFGASQGSSESRSDQAESFIVPEDRPPAAITDLTVAAPGGDEVTLAFTATGDDGTTGQALAYQVRFSDAPILTEADWDAANSATVTASPQASGAAEEIVAVGLPFNTAQHVAVKAIDDNFNPSPVSNSVAVTTLGPPEIDVRTQPFEFVAEPEAVISRTLPITNAGESTLRFSASVQPSSASRARHAARYAEGEAERLASAPPPKTRAEPKDPAVTTSASVMPPAAAAKDRGGPDAFGYQWIDSDEPSGPTYDWIDLAGTASPISLQDDDAEAVALPWSFSFYGEEYTTVNVSSNGYLTFNSVGTTAYTNEPIPSTGVPDNFVAVFWDDLNPLDGGAIYAQDLGDGRFVIQWDGIPHYNSGGTATISVQAILSRSGEIVLQYEEINLDGAGTSHTVGIENASGTDGLEIVHNTAYLREGLAIRISAFWGSITSGDVGTLAPGETGEVEILASAVDLPEGTYDGLLRIESNDPTVGAVEVPLRLFVTTQAPPTAALSTPEITIEAARGEVTTRTITLTNTGAFTLDWSLADASGTLPDWLSIGLEEGTLFPSASVEIDLSATPGTDDPIGASEQTTLRLNSNDPEGPAQVLVKMSVLPGVSTEDGLDFDGPYLLTPPAPNPARTGATATFAVRTPQSVTAEVVDVLGRRVALLHDGEVAAGVRQTLSVDVSSLAAGTYVLLVRGEAFTASRSLTVAR
ncbi:MAG: M36 family metallopeptidase, partial [Bacteroidota bacterium]